MAWLGTPHDGEIVRQRENIGQLMPMIVKGKFFFKTLGPLGPISCRWLDESMMPAPQRVA